MTGYHSDTLLYLETDFRITYINVFQMMKNNQQVGPELYYAIFNMF